MATWAIAMSRKDRCVQLCCMHACLPSSPLVSTNTQLFLLSHLTHAPPPAPAALLPRSPRDCVAWGPLCCQLH